MTQRERDLWDELALAHRQLSKSPNEWHLRWNFDVLLELRSELIARWRQEDSTERRPH